MSFAAEQVEVMEKAWQDRQEEAILANEALACAALGRRTGRDPLVARAGPAVSERMVHALRSALMVVH